MKKRILSLLLVIVMVLGVMPVFAVAESADAKSIVIDFKDSVRKAAEQDFWGDLKDAVGSKYTTKYIGYKGRVGMDETQTAAYESLLTYLWENHGWTIDGAGSYLTTYQTNKGVWLNALDVAEDKDWGIAYLAGNVGTGDISRDGSMLKLNVYVDEAGYYTVNTTAYYSSNTGNLAQYTDCANSGVGGAYADVLVNGVSVLPEGTESYAFSGHGDNAAWANTTQTDEIGSAFFKKGVNVITIDTKATWENSTTASLMRRNVCLKAMELVKFADCAHESVTDDVCDLCGETICAHTNTTAAAVSNGDKTHTVTVTCECGEVVSTQTEACADEDSDGYCDACGAYAAPAGSILIDFKHFAKAAAQQSWWADMKQDADTQEAAVGAWTGWFSAAMTETEAAAYDSMIQFMKDNYDWYLDESATGLKTTTIKKGLWMAGDDYVKWGMSFYAGSLDSAASDFAFKLDVAEAGYYDLDMTAFYEGTTGAIKINAYTGGNDAGGGYVDILVNGRTVLDDHSTNGQGQPYQNLMQTLDVGLVYLNEGENTVTVRPAADLDGVFKSHRRYVALQSMELNYIGTECPHADADGDCFCDACGEAVVDFDTMEIAAEADLIKFSKLVNAGAADLNAVLTADIALTEAWIVNLDSKAIGTPETPYAGTFDGAGHTISGLSMSFNNNHSILGVGTTNQDDFTRDFRLGLFGTVEGADIRNVTVEGTIALSGRYTYQPSDNTVPGYSKIGGLIGYAKNAAVTGCINKVAISGNSNGYAVAFANVGGLIGLADGLTMDKCGNEADLITMAADLGGLVGWAQGAVITNSYNTGDVDGYQRIGGIVGTFVASHDAENPAVIDHCYSTGDFNSHQLDADGAVYTGLTQAAGLVGRGKSNDETVMAYAVISNCYVAGSTVTPISDGWYTALHRYWSGAKVITTTYKNNYFLDGQTYTGYHTTSKSITAEEMATGAFAEKLGGYVLLNDGTSPVLEWQCDHEIVEAYVPGGDTTHDHLAKCANCSFIETVYAEDEACFDEDADLSCDVCGNEVACEHADTTESCTDNGDRTHTVTVTCRCGETLSETVEDCTDEDLDNACDRCGALLLVKFVGTNMTLGNDLHLNFLLKKDAVDAPENYTAVLTKYKFDGETVDYTEEIPGSDWETYTDENYYKFTGIVCSGEMCDRIAVTIYDENGAQVSETYEDTVRDYAVRMLEKNQTDIVNRMIVDMLNYGAAAQQHFKYNVSDPANKYLTEEQQALATQDVTYEDSRVKVTNAYGANLSLKDRIYLHVFFYHIPEDTTGMYGTVSFTRSNGEVVEREITAEDLLAYYTPSQPDLCRVTVDDLVLSDLRQAVTVTVYRADGTVYGSIIDSVESLIARSMIREDFDDTLKDVYINIMKISDSAREYFVTR